MTNFLLKIFGRYFAMKVKFLQSIVIVLYIAILFRFHYSGASKIVMRREKISPPSVGLVYSLIKQRGKVSEGKDSFSTF